MKDEPVADGEAFTIKELYWLWRKFRWNEDAVKILADFAVVSKAEAAELIEVFEKCDERDFR